MSRIVTDEELRDIKEHDACFKQPYKSKSEAQRAARVLSKYHNNKRSGMHPYRCPSCGSYHVGH